MSLPGEFFDDNQISGVMGIESAATLWVWIENGASTPVIGSGAAVPRGNNVVYRGQATAGHGLSSSLYRRCREVKGPAVSEAHLANAETAIIQAMRAEGLGRLMTDGELLMVLQHHAIPTRLIDVSAAAMEALFFAVDHNDAADGRLFIIDVHTTDPMRLDASQELPLGRCRQGLDPKRRRMVCDGCCRRCGGARSTHAGPAGQVPCWRSKPASIRAVHVGRGSTD